MVSTMSVTSIMLKYDDRVMNFLLFATFPSSILLTNLHQIPSL